MKYLHNILQFSFNAPPHLCNMLPDQKTVIIICGPTAVGKTNLAIQLAQHFNTEIISADSRQCFRELNIGVAKPSAEELVTVPHHFINSHSIHEEVNAAVFETYALKAAAEIFASKTVAIMVGGTGLYIKAFTEGLDAVPNVDPQVRTEILEQYNAQGLPFLQQELQQNDPAFWAVAEQQNPQRLMRALEVLRSTGRSITTFQTGAKQQRNFNIIKVGLSLPRPLLNTRINDRIDAMMHAGLLKEVEDLLPYQNLNALQTVGYREFFPVLTGSNSVETAIEELKKNTRHYAKRQMTWFKKDPNINWFDAQEDDLIARIVRLVC